MYTPIIGLEIHVELKTVSKMFCGCKNDPFHAPKPNIYTCPVCLGMPGALPVPNKKAIEWTIMLGLALKCSINSLSKFDRKHYFYPDLPKGYQISQYDQPFCEHGVVEVPEGSVRIRRVHLEEDTGKLLHKVVNGKKVSLIDFNRSGVPLIEIVTEPDIRSGDHAKSFLKKLHQIIRYLNISDADMEKGTMRLEPNISVQRDGERDLPSYKVEVKNINSFNFVKKAIEYEVSRHIRILNSGKTPQQETRGWDEDKGQTFPQRSKEHAEDYRYFPDPDIPPFRITNEQLSVLREMLPELPDEKLKRYQEKHDLPENIADVLVSDRNVAEYFESAVEKGKDLSPKTIANWIVNKKIDLSMQIEDLLLQIRQAKTVVVVSDEEIKQAIARVLQEYSKAVADYKSGKNAAFMFLFGHVIQYLRGRGDKKRIQELLKEALDLK
ncbi:MAG: Asp-tRNA(Asn)/Glu-tRNA(Gln) amidotransferase subunit GatB [Patescibacteria group bacterium]|nr:Asp-tRNA(Asn)/Glu-tRNA(Gln) amidotransferase subunit GatB [Patescibacteria group bacterium]